MAANSSGLDIFSQTVPYSKEAEQSVLGAILIEPNCMNDATEIVKPSFFYNDVNRGIFETMVSMFTVSQKIDLITVAEKSVINHVFTNRDDARSYLYSLTEIVPSIANIKEYCKIVKDKYLLRSLIQTSQEIVSQAADPTADAPVILEKAEQSIYQIREGNDTGSLLSIQKVAIEAYEELQKMCGPNRDEYLGLSTGFSDLDAKITGLHKSDLIIIAARPGMGKTAFGLNIASNVSRISSKVVAIFSLEMSRQQLVQRLLSADALVESQKMRSGMLADSEWQKLATSLTNIRKFPIVMDDTAGITVNEIKSKLRRVPNLGLVIIDYLQLLSSASKNDNRVNVVSEMTRNLKIMAKELNVPVIVISQLSRANESRTDKRPVLSDLRESGSIEQDADIVLMLYRPDYYNKEDENKASECIVAKNRHGDTGSVELIWDGRYTRFFTASNQSSEGSEE